MKEKVDSQGRMDPGAPFSVGGGGPALSAWIGEERNRLLRQELTEAEERMFAYLVCKAKVGELEEWNQFKVSSPEKMGARRKDLVDTRWVLTWKKVDSAKTEAKRLAAKGYQEPDLRTSNVDIAGCVSRGSSHSRPISQGALKQWPLRNLDIENAFRQAGRFDCGVCFRAPCAWVSKDPRRVWQLGPPRMG